MAAGSEERQNGLLARFAAIGGNFVTPVADIRRKLDQCRGVIFDWDGVFNTGRKGRASSSGFSEADSMGTNMLRYGLWLRLGALPNVAIISGENNETAIDFARREHLHGVYTGIRSKQHVITHLCHDNDLKPEQIACIFDDINDLPMAQSCGLRLMVRREASPMLADFVLRRQLCDYVTGAGSSGYAVREICELLLGIMESYDEVVDSRISWDPEYGAYFDARQAVDTQCYVQQGDNFISLSDR